MAIPRPSTMLIEAGWNAWEVAFPTAEGAVWQVVATRGSRKITVIRANYDDAWAEVLRRALLAEAS